MDPPTIEMASFIFLFAALFILRLGSQATPESHFFDPTRVVQLSWQPRAFLYKGFLSNEECDHLIALARDKLEKSMVADNDSGKSVMSDVRTSSGMFLLKDQDETVTRIERRISTWTFLPQENGEPIQVLHYENGQKYEPHFDYFQDKVNQERGGHRVATVLMYLSNVQKGGETIFPDAMGKLSQHKDETWSDCATNGYAMKPNKGDAILFFSLHINATTDPNSLHGSCPVIEGEKWSATKWIHVRSFDNIEKRRSSGECLDENVLCSGWAEAGECQKNHLYMVGSNDSPGFCRKSCRVMPLFYLYSLTKASRISTLHNQGAQGDFKKKKRRKQPEELKSYGFKPCRFKRRSSDRKVLMLLQQSHSAIYDLFFIYLPVLVLLTEFHLPLPR